MDDGIVYLVGAGPGDPDLLTVRARDLLAGADTIVYDRLGPPLYFVGHREDALLIDVGKKPQKHRRSQDEINHIIISEAKAGKKVVRLKGGDSFVFGRGGEEAAALREAGIRYEVVPGITSAVAVPAYAGIPVTHRGLSTEFAVVTGHEDPLKEASGIDWRHLALGVDTIVFLMGFHNLGKIVDKLVSAGRSADTPAALIHRGCSGLQKVIEAPLSRLPEHPEIKNLEPPCITVIGDVVGLRPQIGRWFEELPLFGRSFLCTRAEPANTALCRRLLRLGAFAVPSPLIEVIPRKNPLGITQAMASLRNTDWLVFTSVNGVELFFRLLWKNGRDARALCAVHIAVIGPSTCRALEKWGLKADLTSNPCTAEGLVEAFSRLPMEGCRVLVPRAARARPLLVKRLGEMGALVDEVKLYETVPAKEFTAHARKHFEGKGFDAALLFSPSAASAYAGLLDDAAGNALFPPVVTIGPVTDAEARKLGLKVLAQARTHTENGVIETLVKLFAQKA